MIEGMVNAAREAVVSLILRGPSGQSLEADIVIDTGYDGFLALPPSLVDELGLTFQFRGRAFLANGSEETFGVYSVTVVWDGQPRSIETDAVGVEPLAGMALLDAHSLYVEVVDGGRVVIRSIEW